MKVPKARLKSGVVTLVVLLLFSLNVAAQTPTATDNEYQAGGVLWMQLSGERAALSYQAFALGRMVLDRDIRTSHGKKRRAVIVDVDETIVDNSRYQAGLIKNRQNFNDQTWLEWINRAEASAIPAR